MRLVYLAAAWIAGIVIAKLVPLPSLLWSLWLVVPIALLLLWWRDRSLRLFHFCLLLSILAALRYTAALPSFDERALASFNDHGAISITGDVVEPPEVRDRTTFVRFSVTRIRVENAWRDVSGLALLQAPRETEIRYGDRVQVYGEPATPFEAPDFSYKDYLARQGIHSVIRTYGRVTLLARDQGNPFFAALYTFRAHALATIDGLFPEPAAALLAGILLGDDSGMPADLTGAFATTNTAHIIAISGFNVGIIAGILAALARRLFKSRAIVTLVIILGLAVYTLLVGAGASVVRAAIMGGLSVLALYFNRQNSALNTLAGTALVMSVLDPLIIFDMSFQLSFLATLGLVLYVEPLTNRFEQILARVTSVERARQIIGLLSDSLIVTLAAQITTTPLILFAFHRLSLVGLLTNFLILPAQPAVMIWGGLATLVGMVLQPLGQLIAYIAWAFLEWTIVVVEATAALPFSALDVGRFDILFLLFFYLILFGATLVDWSTVPAWFGTRAHPGGSSGLPSPANATADLSRIPLPPALAVGGGVVALVLAGNILQTAPDGRVHIQFLDAGGAATLVQTPNGARLLVDGGANPSVTLSALGSAMPFWDRSVDLLVLTQADDAHVAGLVAALEHYNVRRIVQVDPPAKPTAAYTKWCDLIATRRVPTLPAQAGLSLVVDQVEIQLLDHPPVGAAMVRLRAGNQSVLLAHDADIEAQGAMVDSEPSLASPILAAPAHLSPEFLAAIDPQYAILFTGTTARDKPSAELLTALSNIHVLRTDERGTIEMIVEGEGVRMRTER